MAHAKLTHMPHVEARMAAERRERLAAMGDPETFDCAACGRIGEGCFGFGRIRGVSAGLFACQQLECRAVVEARVYGRQPTAAAAVRAVGAPVEFRTLQAAE